MEEGVGRGVGDDERRDRCGEGWERKRAESRQWGGTRPSPHSSRGPHEGQPGEGGGVRDGDTPPQTLHTQRGLRKVKTWSIQGLVPPSPSPLCSPLFPCLNSGFALRPPQLGELCVLGRPAGGVTRLFTLPAPPTFAGPAHPQPRPQMRGPLLPLSPQVTLAPACLFALWQIHKRAPSGRHFWPLILFRPPTRAPWPLFQL